jgi:hypothetical protein
VWYVENYESLVVVSMSLILNRDRRCLPACKPPWVEHSDTARCLWVVTRYISPAIYFHQHRIHSSGHDG